MTIVTQSINFKLNTTWYKKNKVNDIFEKKEEE